MRRGLKTSRALPLKSNMPALGSAGHLHQLPLGRQPQPLGQPLRLLAARAVGRTCCRLDLCLRGESLHPCPCHVADALCDRLFGSMITRRADWASAWRLLWARRGSSLSCCSSLSGLKKVAAPLLGILHTSSPSTRSTAPSPEKKYRGGSFFATSFACATTHGFGMECHPDAAESLGARLRSQQPNCPPPAARPPCTPPPTTTAP